MSLKFIIDLVATRLERDYYRDQLDLIAEHFGEKAYICADGSLSDEPVRGNIVNLVSALVRENINLTASK